jgi:serine protease Do
VASECVTAAEAHSRSEEQARAATLAAAAEARTRQERDAARLEQLRAQAQSTNENFLAIAFALFGFAILAGAANFVYQLQNKPRERRAALIAAAVLGAGAVILFLMRPNPADVSLSSEPALPTPKGAAATAASAIAASATDGTGPLMCVLDRNSGRITVSAGEDTRMTFAPGGCVNGRTQYVDQGDGRWSRILVPNQDSTVSRMSYNPATRAYTVQRYLLPLREMQAIRAQRARVAVQSCTGDATALATLSRREAAIAAMLPAQPNEELVYRCRAARAEDMAPPAPPRPALTPAGERQPRPPAGDTQEPESTPREGLTDTKPRPEAAPSKP